MWNGVTTNVFANIIYTIITKKIKIPNNFHLVPKNKVTKYELMNYLKEHFQYKDLHIIKKNSKLRINRSLDTIHQSVNNKIWLSSKYNKKPNIKEIVSTI